MRIAIVTSAACLLIACTTSSGVMPFGPDTYKIMVGSELGGYSKAQQTALMEANQYCTQQGLNMMPQDTKKTRPKDFLGDAIPHYELTFMCLERGDQELVRPKMQKEADVVVETRGNGSSSVIVDTR